MAYLDLDEFAAYIGSERSDDEDALERSLAAAEAAIDDHCGRTFSPPATDPITKTYAPGCNARVLIHDLVDTTSLVVSDNGTTLAADAFQLEPLQQWVGARPYYQIRRLTGCWYADRGRPTLSITSPRWGWASVPPEVVEATAVLAKDLVHLRDNRFGVAGFGEYGAIRVRDNPHVKMLLAPFRHPSTIGIA